jgi:secondary thiamine-phosphate synthase enzyme
MPDPLKNAFFVSSHASQQFIDITGQVQTWIDRSGVKSGVCFLFLPHTTAALTLNENWDPAVPADILHTLEHQTAPSSPVHMHEEGNSPAHVRSSLFGASQFILIEEGRLVLGSWQGIFLAEFDGPRERRVVVKVMAC